ncbi:hypothetical protein RHMOL_Rhmol01G0082200 [Rhododendron molle]|uniref:Uncharacterized protein n=1 Tax=Rhododendron molle TaxID=49168 RepID=A0ACC0PZ04_RHOML|nr:hypothetical protein RHMOL_Rhmol01G0082200 [Rhododendron molle]
MEDGTTNSTIDRYAKVKKGSWFNQFWYGSNPWMARYVYGLMFLVATLLAWAVRDYGHTALKEMERLKECEGGKECLGTEGVLRVSLGCFIFYSIMFLSTVGTSKLYGGRELWQSGWWSAKILLMIGLTVVPFFVPSIVIRLYGDVAHFGAGYDIFLLYVWLQIMPIACCGGSRVRNRLVFLVIQLISIISFITWLNDCCQSDKNAEKCRIHAMLLATTAYVVCIMGIILMYIWYAPAPSCFLNIFLITFTLAILQFMTSVSLHPKFTAYETYDLHKLYPPIEPPDSKCIKKVEAATKSDWLSIISFVIAVLAIVIATFSTGIDSQCFQFKKDVKESEDDVPYGFGFFHFVFATGAMYFAMLLISWNSHHTAKKWTIDVGWTSTWVRILNELLAACLYAWMLVAPSVWKSRQTAGSV